MQCLHPIDVSVKTGSDCTTISVPRFYTCEDGTKVRKKNLSVPVVNRSSFLVPCGKCFACKSRKKSQYVFRMDQERRNGHLLPDGSIKKYKYCFFVTLTYAERSLPRFVPVDYSKDTGEVYSYYEVPEAEPGILYPEHLTSYMKRLRRYAGLDCKVFSCGEYGDDGHRPHYHQIFYSDLNWQDTVNAIRRAWSFKCPKELRRTPGSFLVQDGIYKTWRFSFGRVQVKPVNIRRMRYCAKYICKDNDSKQPIPKFARVSNGLGTGFLLTKEANSIKRNKLLFAYTVDGNRASLGRYFTHRIFSKEELHSAVDCFINDNETPPDGSEGTLLYRSWYDEHIANKNAFFRASLARSIMPKLMFNFH